MSTREEALKRLDELEEKFKTELSVKTAQVASLQTALKNEQQVIKQLEQELVKAREDPLLSEFRDVMEKVVIPIVEKRMQTEGMPIPAGVPGGQQTLGLVRMKTTITAKVDHRALPTASTLTLRGKIVDLIAQGKLDSKKEQSVIMSLLPPDESRGAVYGELKKLVEEQVLMILKDPKHTYYQRHPDVEAKEV